MNRFLITMGELTKDGSGNPLRGANAADATKVITTSTAGTKAAPNANNTGVSISYNAAGERVQAFNATDGSLEKYAYTNDGYLQDVSIRQSDQTADVLRSRRANDELGRVKVLTEWTAGNATGVGQTVSYTKTTVYDAGSRVASESGTDGSTSYIYAANGGDLAYTSNYNAGTTVTTYYGYEYWDDAKITAIQAQGYNPKLKKNNRIWKPGYSDISYDVNGHISGAVDW